jgi:hypothetical protein
VEAVVFGGHFSAYNSELSGWKDKKMLNLAKMKSKVYKY